MSAHEVAATWRMAVTGKPAAAECSCGERFEGGESFVLLALHLFAAARPEGEQ